MRTRGLPVALAVVVVVVGGLVAAAVFAWPRVGLAGSDVALARVVLPGLAGRVAAVRVRDEAGAGVPVEVRRGRLWPAAGLAAGERLTVEVTVRRPGWAAWLVGRSERRTFTIETPTARVRARWLLVRAGAPVVVTFDDPVSVVSLAGGRPRRLARPGRAVRVGVVVGGARGSGAIEVAAAARSWERLSAPVRVTWFVARSGPQLLAQPAPNSTVGPDRKLALTFSVPVRELLGARRPRLTPATPGRWRLLDAHTLVFEPAGLGFGLGVNVRVVLPRPVYLTGHGTLTRTLAWQVPPGSTLRLQQLLAQLGYLPLAWHPDARAGSLPANAQLVAAVTPPPGRFSWRYPRTPPELHALWHPGRPNAITRGAVMMFEHDHRLAVDAIAGPRVWRQLLADAIAGHHRRAGYSYVYVHRNVPQSLNLWHDGRLILSSPGNTGVPAAPTQLGTFPVFEHIPIGTMSGTNPDGSHYRDPGIRFISYFHGGDAIHAFNRATFGTPQSLGCVELPLAAAAEVWPYTPIGTLVTIED